MGPSTTDVVVVGASLTAALVAETLRDRGHTGRITLVGEESHRPYERPPLSKGVLTGAADRETLFVHESGWYPSHGVELLVGTTVVAVDRGAHQVVLDGGERLPYGSLVLATGARPRALAVPGGPLRGVFHLRRIEDAERLRGALAQATRVAVIGGGWIGLEVASAARTAGAEVTVLHHGALPLERALGAEMAQMFADLHRENGVTLRPRSEVVGLEGVGAVTGVTLVDGTSIDADVVVVGIGVEPCTDLARAAGLAVGGPGTDRGIVVDEHLRTVDPHIWAAGDVASAFSPRLGRYRRVEHWENARRQGALAARAILGEDATDDRPSFVFSDQFDLGMEYTGDLDDPGRARVVVRGDVPGRELVAFWLDGNRVLAGMNVNVWDVAGQIEELVMSGRAVDETRLADPTVPLEQV
ncbi:MAG TPA: FAD-dependent oxidoreductase [Cellulomonadaceae bacterium]|nr:FAD-dependent oxidoreductase [Cellulomonadaceae bacterium]